LKSLKFMLVNPPGKCWVRKDGSVSERKHKTPPLGLAYLAATLRKAGHEVAVLDALAENYEREWRRGDFILYGLDAQETAARVAEFQPDIVGVSVMFSNRIWECLEIAREVKQLLPNVKIVFGGQHSTGLPEKIIQHDEVDFVLLGECDLSIVALADSLAGRHPLSQVPGLYYKADGQVRNTISHLTPKIKGEGWSYLAPKDSPSPRKITKLPYPAWDLFPMEKYWTSDVRIGGGDVVSTRFGLMVTSRGCPWNCYFCASSLMAGYKSYRMRDVDDVMGEIDWLIREYGVEEIQFMEDNFFVNRERVIRILSELIRSFPRTVFSVPSGTDINMLDEEIIGLMAKANFHKITLAVEAGDQELQKALISKNVQLHRVPKILSLIREHGMQSRGLFMIGFPDERREQVMKTVEMAQTLGFDDFFISLVTPFPGTPLYDECERRGLLRDDFDIDNLRYSVANIKLPDMEGEELETLRRDVWLEYHKTEAFAAQGRQASTVKEFKTTDEYETVGFKTLDKPKAQS
jgi:anaerobic magnesium-protoporphyrin IX monomethyl ester cyclase